MTEQRSDFTINRSPNEGGAVFDRPRRKPRVSTNELINRAFREPFFRFLLFLAALGRHWYWVLPASLILGVLIAGSIWLLKKGTYTSEIWLRIHTERRYIVYQTTQTPSEASLMVQTYLQFLYSPPVMNGAWMNIAEKAQSEGKDIDFILGNKDPAQWLTRNISSRRQGEATIYVIGMTTEDARLSQLIIESLMTSYFNFLDENSKTYNRELIKNLQEIAESKKKEIEDMNNEYNRLSQRIAEQGGDLPSELSNQMIRAAQNSLSDQISHLPTMLWNEFVNVMTFA